MVPLLKNNFEVISPTHKEYDITKIIDKIDCNLIINSVAYTKVQEAEENKLECFDINVRGTLNLLTAYPNVPFVYISTEYAYKPVNFYSLTKNFAEELVKRHLNFLIIRTLFKPKPYPWDVAFINQFTEGGYITDVAPRINEVIMNWSRKGKTIILVGDGRGRKTMFDLAKETRPDVRPNLTTDIKGVMIPTDYK